MASQVRHGVLLTLHTSPLSFAQSILAFWACGLLSHGPEAYVARTSPRVPLPYESS